MSDVEAFPLPLQRGSELTDFQLLALWGEKVADGTLRRPYMAHIASPLAFCLSYRHTEHHLWAGNAMVEAHAWVEPLYSIGVYGVWIRPAHRKTAEASTFIWQTLQAFHAAFPVLLLMTPVPKVARRMEEMYRFVRLTTIPALFDGEDGLVLVHTPCERPVPCHLP